MDLQDDELRDLVFAHVDELKKNIGRAIDKTNIDDAVKEARLGMIAMALTDVFALHSLISGMSYEKTIPMLKFSFERAQDFLDELKEMKHENH